MQVHITSIQSRTILLQTATDILNATFDLANFPTGTVGSKSKHPTIHNQTCSSHSGIVGAVDPTTQALDAEVHMTCTQETTCTILFQTATAILNK